MKLLYCQLCSDIVAPYPTPNTPRFCRCGGHAVWWVNPATGELRLYEVNGRYDPPDPNYPGGSEKEAGWHRKRSPHTAFVLGLHNDLLRHGHQQLSSILAATPESYIFKQSGSLIVRIRPGESNDTDWADAIPKTA